MLIGNERVDENMTGSNAQKHVIGLDLLCTFPLQPPGKQ